MINGYSGAVVFALVAMGIALRAAIPAGFMPHFGDDAEGGGFTFIICTAQGSSLISVGGGTAPSDPADDGTGTHSGDGCWFAGLATPSVPLPGAIAPFTRFFEDPAPAFLAFSQHRAVIGLLRGPPLGARAPPSLSLV